jgi:hypothetical protein
LPAPYCIVTAPLFKQLEIRHSPLSGRTIRRIIERTFSIKVFALMHIENLAMCARNSVTQVPTIRVIAKNGFIEVARPELFDNPPQEPRVELLKPTMVFIFAKRKMI